jgi:hypothetical protein
MAMMHGQTNIKPNEFEELNYLITSVSLLIPAVERTIIKEAIFVLRNI